ncbi:MAG TPA: hypothetical protein VFF73_34205 [Planctomycetota bacterium]|nr:hypothetical protein [Planctomycetota bacterium]
MRKNLLRATIALVVLAATGCTSPGFATTSFSQAEPTATPEPAVRTTRGTLSVATFASPRREDMEADHRGYAIFDAEGRRVLESHGFAGAQDRVRLAPGRYVVVSLTGEGFDRRLEKRQALVASGLETRVDFVHAPAASLEDAN